ncbi:MAG TPA: AsnC family transcriptional regulator [Casimicrobiaceae bacterium]|nr:AsnC family transcriptional regulator [Casimicrobiaceae bacterium]
MDKLDRAIVDRLQTGFPVCERPFLEAADSLGTTEDELIARIDRLLRAGTLTRFGPLFQIERMGGVFTLAAICVPAAEFERTAAAVNALPEVAHNYARQHPLNMWFVLATESAEATAAAIDKIEARTGLPVLVFPKEREFFVGLDLKAVAPADGEARPTEREAFCG